MKRFVDLIGVSTTRTAATNSATTNRPKHSSPTFSTARKSFIDQPASASTTTTTTDDDDDAQVNGFVCL